MTGAAKAKAVVVAIDALLVVLGVVLGVALGAANPSLRNVAALLCTAMVFALGVILGAPLGFSFRDHLERRICGWFPGADEE